MATERQTQTDRMKRVIRNMVERAINAGHLDAVDEAYSPDVRWHGPGGREIRGRDGLKEMISGYRHAFPDLRMTIERQVAEGDALASEWRCTGTHRGPLDEIEPTGREVDVRGHVMSRFEGGRIVEEFEVFDELEMLRQIGVVER